MNTIIEITTANGQFYFDLFYFLAIIFAGVFFILDGKRKQYPLTEWTLIFASAIIFFIIGTKLFTYTIDEWKEIISNGSFPSIERKTIFGGILGSIFGIWIAKKLIRFPNPVLDSFAVSLPLAMAIQSMGCFMAGCCYGTPSNVPWAVSYSYYAIPYYSHLFHGLINETSKMSLAIHPIQLYQTLLCLIIACIVWKLKHKIKRPGNLFLSSIVLYCASRFIVEFWQNSDFNEIANMLWMGIKYQQWALIGSILLITVYIYIREKKFVPKPSPLTTLRNPVGCFIFISLLLMSIKNWFTVTEFIFILIVLIPTTVLQLNKILRQDLKGFSFRLASLSLLLLFLVSVGILTAQKTYNKITKEDVSRNSFNDVSLGYGNFQFSHYHEAPDQIYVPATTGCYYSPGSPSHYDYQAKGPKVQHSSNAIGLGFTHTETFGKFNKIAIAAEISGGRETEKGTTTNNPLQIYDFSPSIKLDSRWIGGGLGLHFGSNISEEKVGNIIYSLNNNSKYNSGWSGSVRLFPYDIFYIELQYNDMFPYQIGNRTDEELQFVAGSGLGFKDGSGIQIGYSGDGISFFSAKAWFLNRIGIKASLYSYSTDYRNQLMQFSVAYRFSQKHWVDTHLKR
ncbi:MAG: prolipoprotein diacylglyceryl transferase [Bacteroidales bacterium]